MHLHEKTRGYRGFVEFWTTATDASGTGDSQSGMLLFGRVIFRSHVLVAYTQDAETILSIFSLRAVLACRMASVSTRTL